MHDVKRLADQQEIERKRASLSEGTERSVVHQIGPTT